MEILTSFGIHCSVIGFMALAISSVAGKSINSKISLLLIIGGISASVLGCISGYLTYYYTRGYIATYLGGGTVVLTAISYLLYTTTTIPRDKIDEQLEEDEPGTSSDSEEDEFPEEDDRPIHCFPEKIKGPNKKNVKLAGEAWNKSFRSEHEVLVRSEYMFFQAQATGRQYYGFWWQKYKCEISWLGYIYHREKDPVYLFIECIDGCKIVPEKNGSFRGQDGPLVIEFDVNWDILDSMDTIYIYVKAMANIEGVVSASINHPSGVVGVSVNDTTTTKSSEMGTWVWKCEEVR